jgi:hypothetical protein
MNTLMSMIANHPKEIIVATIEANYKQVSDLVASLDAPNISVVSIPHANKREQIVAAIPRIETSITVLADDDVWWQSTLLDQILAPLEQNATIGGVATCQRVRRLGHPTWSERLWEYLGALYIERRNFETRATYAMDGGTSCLSGRTVAYRSAILKDQAFMFGFTHEMWRGRYRLKTDDDNFITRWLVNHGWGTAVQQTPEAEVLTTLETNSKFFTGQCMRWSRSNWRSNFTSLFVEQNVIRSVYAFLIRLPRSLRVLPYHWF